jgi:acyl-CoA synthetase (AMP-forming)/AMP-acid ligase II
VQTGVNYAVILSNNAGLWGYSIGDTVKFVSLNPYRIIVTGRVKHFISAFGEHVIGEEVEKAMQTVTNKYGASVIEFHVAPQVNPPEGGLPYHEWWVAFASPPESIEAFADDLDVAMRQQNVYYDDLIRGGILRRLVIRSLVPDAFRDYMRSMGKLGGQNKVPRLANDRSVADALERYLQ